jgi:hypothetical protein
MPRTATAGQIAINSVLPPEYRDYGRVLDKKELSNLLSRLAKENPDKYRDVTFQLNKIGQRAAYFSGGNSYHLEHLKMTARAKHRRLKIKSQLQRLLDDDEISDEDRRTKIIKLAAQAQKEERDEIFDDSIAEQNPLALQILGAGRGNKMNLASLRGSDWLYQDHHGNVIPTPVMRSYSQGLTPAEYWAGTYGARLGTIATKFATADSGFLGKQLAQAAHRLLVTQVDSEKEPETIRGLPADTDDTDNIGALLAAPAGDFKRNTVITPRVLQELRRKGIKRVLARSPMISGPEDGGVYARDVGVRERGDISPVGEFVGLMAAQAVSEPLSQSQLSMRHSGGVVGETASLSGFDYINQVIQAPKVFKGGAAHARLDGVVQAVDPAPAGGHFITINNEKHYVGRGYDPKVKIGQEIEAGDLLSDGIPNPSEIVKYKGLGEGRRYFVSTLMDAFRSSNVKAARRNVELLARGFVNHVRLNKELGDYVPDDIVPYSSIEHIYKPREGFRSVAPKQAVGKYLERPYLHHSIGTKIRPSMLKDFEEFGVKQVDVHDDEPPFQPEMVRGMYNLQHDPDWMTKMYGSNLKTGLLKSVHRGGTSTTAGTSFVPSRAKAVDFGREGIIGKTQSSLLK